MSDDTGLRKKDQEGLSHEISWLFFIKSKPPEQKEKLVCLFQNTYPRKQGFRACTKKEMVASFSCLSKMLIWELPSSSSSTASFPVSLNLLHLFIWRIKKIKTKKKLNNQTAEYSSLLTLRATLRSKSYAVSAALPSDRCGHLSVFQPQPI